MKALVFDGPRNDAGTTRIADIPEPTPGPGQIAVTVEYAGVNFKDLMQRRGDPGYVAAWPFTPGLEVLGTVRALGEGVTALGLGERVTAITGSGGLAEVAVVDARLAAVAPPDPDLDPTSTASAILATAELLFGTLGRIRPGDTVLSHSASGGIGQAIAALADRYQLGPLVGTVGAASRVEAALKAGFHTVVVRDSQWTDTVADAVPGGVDLVLDPLGTTQIERDLTVLAPGGRITVFGNAAGTTPGSLPPLAALMARNASINAFSLAALCATAPDIVGTALHQVMHHIATNAVKLNVTVLDGLEDVPEAHQHLATGRAPGKYIARIAAG